MLCIIFLFLYILAADDCEWAEVNATGMPVAMVVDLLLADKASAVEFPPINDLFKILRFESVAVLNFAYKKHKHTCTNKFIEYKKYVNIVLHNVYCFSITNFHIYLPVF